LILITYEPKRIAYGPSKPQLEQRYLRENFLHFSHLHISTWAQLGQWNFVALSPGFTGLLHEVHSGREIVVWDISLEAPSRSGRYRLLNG
jgi:hypothetical protein